MGMCGDGANDCEVGTHVWDSVFLRQKETDIINMVLCSGFQLDHSFSTK